MGVDIHFDLQKRDSTTSPWETLKDDWQWDMDRPTYAFAYLFGVRNHAHYKPIAARRGFPADYPETEDRHDGCHSYSYLTATDVRAIDWSGEGTEVDEYLHCEIWRDGKWVSIGGHRPNENDLKKLNDGVLETTIGNDRYRYVLRVATGEDAKSDSFVRLFEFMLGLADDCGDDNVRLVVWFGG